MQGSRPYSSLLTEIEKMSNRKRSLSMLLIPLIFAAGITGGIFMGRYFFTTDLSPREAKLHALLELIEEQYVDEVDMIRIQPIYRPPSFRRSLRISKDPSAVSGCRSRYSTTR